MSFGKSGGTSYTTPELTPEQRAQIQAQNEFFTGTIAPTYQGAVRGATDLYNLGAPGVTRAAQNLAGAAGAAGESLGATGESALRTGITGLQSLFGPDYERQQLSAAMAPAQMQYEQNLANQRAQFGGMGNLGSARQALAERQLAGSTQATQAATAANILKDIADQRAGVGATLSQLGQGGLRTSTFLEKQCCYSFFYFYFFQGFAKLPFLFPYILTYFCFKFVKVCTYLK
jgi:hypothetical protein